MDSTESEQAPGSSRAAVLASGSPGACVGELEQLRSETAAVATKGKRGMIG
jgi:hypothetical protein